MTNKYNCSQMDLYVIARLGWRNCRANLDAIAQLMPQYTEAFIEEALLEIDAAEEMPDAAARKEPSLVIRESLKTAADVCVSR